MHRIILVVSLVLVVLLAWIIPVKAQEKPNKYQKTAEIISAKYNKDPDKISEIVNTVVEISEQKGVDPVLTLAVIATESEFNPNAYNRSSGASGLTQVLKGLHAKLIASYNGSIFDPYVAIHVGTDLLKTYSNWWNGNTKKALGSYGGDHSGQYYSRVMYNYNWINKTVEKDI